MVSGGVGAGARDSGYSDGAGELPGGAELGLEYAFEALAYGLGYDADGADGYELAVPGIPLGSGGGGGTAGGSGACTERGAIPDTCRGGSPDCPT